MRFGSLPITLRQLQYACAVAEELSFRKAAARCHVSQPSLSAQIAELERMLEVQLFERDRRRVLLTRAGEAVIGRARAVLLAAEDVVDAATRHGDPLVGALRVGVIPTIAPYLLPDLDPALREAFANLQLQWTEDKTETLVAMLGAGELDVALLALEAEIGELDYVKIGEDPFVLAAPRGHALAARRSAVTPEALADARVYLLDDGHCFREQAADLCAVTGAREQGFRATSLTTLVQLAGGGDGVTILPALAVEVENRRARLVIRKFRRPAPRRTIVFAWRRGSALADSLRELAAPARRALAVATRGG
ncbi:LysR substrate-binding domain-containing protein [Enhygromyxa salina]|uniref:Hydrogen peroxide-inducible genes activator n=1 Tax=Enhygromyxa salina TaxID=215803 RepID=A0A2S9XQM7_9BACT|nr:LysR substrate-binding domain-containing protein [Enhygromyxa salina]PRP95156.1 Hydrogen peroxide-inducible genes activator [Enhygromyxa salina]